MKQAYLKVAAVAALSIFLGACGTTPAPDFHGRWRPVNRFAEKPTEIPLYTSYVYQATPMDGTLKTMLERWAKDSGRTLDYKLSYDYTLYGAISKIDTTSALQAASDVSAAYASQGVSVIVAGNAFVVSTASVLPASAPPASSGR